MKTHFAILAAALALAAPAHAASVLDPILGNPGDCYFREYDAAHLRTHPRQRVQTIAIGHSDTYQDRNFELTLDLAFTLRSGATYTVVGLCRGNVCSAEGDGGQFTLTTTNGALRLDVDPERGLGAEGRTDYSGNLYESDDKVFLLRPARSALCKW